MRDELIKRKEVVAIWKTPQNETAIGFKTEDAFKKALTIKDFVPLKVNGLPTILVMVGEIKALQLRTEKWRPAPPGVSIGHRDITAGTLGGIYKLNNEIVILSNNHVLANSNNGIPGDPIYQPGPYDLQPPSPPTPPCPFANMASKPLNLVAKLFNSSWRLKPYKITEIDPEYHLANLLDFYPIDFSGKYNYIDAAIAAPLDPSWVIPEILELGYAKGFGEAALEMNVIKSGRTTGITRGVVNGIDGLIKVSYGDGKTAIFANQIITGKMLEGGDSGSNLLEESTMKVVGLGFAGSNTIAIFNPIDSVIEWKNIEIV